jgi:hypothetical protein
MHGQVPQPGEENRSMRGTELTIQSLIVRVPEDSGNVFDAAKQPAQDRISPERFAFEGSLEDW